MNADVRSGDDFNAYINGTWIDNSETPADRAGNSVGLEVMRLFAANQQAL